MTARYSLRRRLALGLAAVLTLLWIGGVVVSGLVVRHELDEAFDGAMVEIAQRLLSLAATDILNSDDAVSDRRISPLREGEEYLTYLVRDGMGNILLRSHDAEPSHFPARPVLGFSDTPSHRIYGSAAISGSIFIEVAEPLERRREAAMESTLYLALPLVLFLPISLFVVWWMVRRGLRPVLSLTSEIEARGAGDLSAVSDEGLPDEIGPIADAVNLLMQRLRFSLEAERNFTANSAHELRTPIAGALAQTQRLIANLPDGEMKDRAGQVESSLHALTSISEKLMQLARAEGGGLLSETKADLGPVLTFIVDEFNAISDHRGRIRFADFGKHTLTSRLDADAFGILMRNLIENALKHSPAGSLVDILVPTDGEIRVVNQAARMNAKDISELTKRFQRGSTTSAGSGLGLAIASAISESAGVGLELRSPATGREDGFEVRVELGPA